MTGASFVNLLVFCTSSVFGLSLVLNHYSKKASTGDPVPTVATARCADECFKTAACTEFSVETNGTCTLHQSASFAVAYTLVGNTCGPGWTGVGGHCFFVGEREGSYNDARLSCSSHDSYLATIHSDKDQRTIETLRNVAGLQMNSFWLGGKRTTVTFSNGTYAYTSTQIMWDNGEPWDYDNFAPGEPSGDGDCIQLTTTNNTSKWYDGDCDSVQYFVCKK